MKENIKYGLASLKALFSVKTLLATVMAIVLSSAAYAQGTITVTGTVKDAAGQPMIGATVFVVNGQAGTTTDAKGHYSIKAPANGTLEYQFLGYTSQQLKVNNRTTINVTLKEDTVAIEEVVAVGYSTMAKTDLTGSITNVRMSDVEDAPVTSIDQALQGRVAGADIMSTTGEPGATTSIRIRGTRSITASNEPLIVVDDVIDAVSDLGDINPADVKSISVLKDASSTAIYGARGSNGVIIVTTNKGQQGKPSIKFKADVGFSQLPRALDIMDASEFARYRNDVYYFRRGSSKYNQSEENYRYPNPEALGKGTDWVKAITRTGLYQNYNLSISGGDKKSKYFASFGYHNNQGIVICSGVQRFTGRLNIDRQFFKWLKIGANLSYDYRDNDNNKTYIGGTRYYDAAIYLNPLLEPTDTVNDLYGTGFDGGQPFNSPYLRAHLVSNNTIRKSTNITPFVEIKFKPYLTFKSRFSYFAFHRHMYQYTPGTIPTYAAIAQGGVAYRAENSQIKLTNENTLSLRKMFRKVHWVEAMLGFTMEKYTENNLTMQGTGYLDDNVRWDNMGAIPDKKNLSVSTTLNERTRMSGLMRLYYNYKRRLYFTFTARADGSSTFAKNNKWGFFPSGAFKWMINKERFMVNTSNWLDEFALRLSAGLSGNDAISYYRSLAALSNSTGGWLFGENQPVAFYPSRLASEDLTWEKTAMYNAAIDFAVFNRRLEFTLEGYYARTTDLLLSVQLASQTGFTSRYANLGTTQNAGVELSITSRNIMKPKFTWTTTFTISHNKQKVLDIGTDEYVSAYNSPGNNSYMMYGYVKGYPLAALWGFKYQGVWHNQDEIDRNKHTKAYCSPAINPNLGAPKYTDVNHDGLLNVDDLVFLGSADPIVQGGLQNTFNIGKLKIGVYFTYSVGGKIYNLTEFYMAGSAFTNQYRYMLNAWHPERNPQSNVPAAYRGQDDIASSRMLHDASFIRLKNVSIGYTFDLRKYTKVLRDITISASGENLYLWKNYNGFDPDVSTESSGSTIRRMDNGAYPKPRTIIFSVQLRY